MLIQRKKLVTPLKLELYTDLVFLVRIGRYFLGINHRYQYRWITWLVHFGMKILVAPLLTIKGMVQANVGQKLVICDILRVSLVTDSFYFELLLVGSM